MALARLVIAAALALLGLPASAQAPTTLAYQGRLADAGGTPISASLSISFRLYTSPAGGAPLWSETQNAVDVDGGNLAVELGRVVPLPRSVWGQQLYLGIQIAGDSEMAPRPRLTASPYALRAGSLQKRTVVVSAEGTPQENGSALLQAVAGITDASASAPVAIELDAGLYDLGTQRVVLPSHTALIGKGQAATVITSAFSRQANHSATLQLSANTEVRQLTARNTGISTIDTENTFGIAANDDSQTDATPIGGVRLQDVTGESIAPTGALGGRAGIYFCAFNSSASDITGRAYGGQYAMGLRADCPGFELSIDGAQLEAADASLGIRGTYLVGGRGSRWSRLRVRIDVPASAESAYGIRFLGAGSFSSTGPAGVLSDSSVLITGPGSATTSTLRADGIAVENGAQIEAIEGARIRLNGVRAASVVGIRLRDASSNTPALAALRIRDSELRISAMQEPALGIGETVGLRAEGYPPLVHGLDLQLECRSGDVAPCIGLAQPENWTEPNGAGEWRIERSRVQVRHVNSGGGTARSAALQAKGRTRIEASSLGLLRSAGQEPVNLLRWLSPAARIDIQHSTLTSANASDGNATCLFEHFNSAGAGGEWFGNHLQGVRCDGGQLNLICAGNTLRGSGFLAGSCP